MTDTDIPTTVRTTVHVVDGANEYSEPNFRLRVGPHTRLTADTKGEFRDVFETKKKK